MNLGLSLPYCVITGTYQNKSKRDPAGAAGICRLSSLSPKKKKNSKNSREIKEIHGPLARGMHGLPTHTKGQIIECCFPKLAFVPCWLPRYAILW